MTEELTDAMRAAIVGAWLAGAHAVHDEWACADEVGRFFLSRDPDPDFTEAAHDYAASNSPTTNGEVTPRAASDDEVERVMACWMEIRRTLNHQQSEGIITYGELKAGVNNAAYIRDAAIGKDAVERWESRAAALRARATLDPTGEKA